MTGIVPDVNIQGQIAALTRWLAQSEFAGLWNSLELNVHTFEGLGWAINTPDREVWNRCQSNGLVLITDNRNHDGSDSLEATLRDSVLPDSLPVVTISDKEALWKDRAYAERVAVDLLEILSDTRDFGTYLGAGRLFLPKNSSI